MKQIIKKTMNLNSQILSPSKAASCPSAVSAYDFLNHWRISEHLNQEYFLDTIYQEYMSWCQKQCRNSYSMTFLSKWIKKYCEQAGHCVRIRKASFAAQDNHGGRRVDKRCVSITKTAKDMELVRYLDNNDYNRMILKKVFSESESVFDRYRRLSGKYDASKVVDVDSKIEECMRTMKGGDPSFSVKENARNSKEILPTAEQEWHFMAKCPLDDLEFTDDAQRQRFDCIKDKVVRKMSEDFDYDKLQPLFATKFIDARGKAHLICTDGYGRYLGAKTNGHIKHLPVCYRVTKDYAKIPAGYFASHDANNFTKITRGNDFVTMLKNGNPFCNEMANTATANGLQFDPTAMGTKNYMKFSNYDITQITWKHGDKKSLTEEDIDRYRQLIVAYARIRYALNDGYEIFKWVRTVDALYRGIAELNRSHPGMKNRLTLDSLIRARGSVMRKKGNPMLIQWSRNNKWTLRGAIDDVFRVLQLKTAGMTSGVWFEKCSGEMTWFDLLRHICLSWKN